MQDLLETHSFSFSIKDLAQPNLALPSQTINSLLPFKFSPEQILPPTPYCVKQNTNQLQTYEVTTNTYTSYTIANQSSYDYHTPSIAFFNNMLYVSGGSVNSEPIKSVHCFDTSTSVTGVTWRRLADMPIAVRDHGFVASPDGEFLYVIGGYDGSDWVQSCYRYALCEDRWERFVDLPMVVAGNGGVSFWDHEDFRSYCVVSVGNRNSQGQVLVCNVSTSKDKDKEEEEDSLGDRTTKKGVWSRVDVGLKFSAKGCYTQVSQVTDKEAIVVVSDNRVYSLRIGSGGGFRMT